jgi:hypothetical protein
VAIIFDNNLLRRIAVDEEKRHQLYKLVDNQADLLDHPAFRDVMMEDVANALINERETAKNDPQNEDVPLITEREFSIRINKAEGVLGEEVRDIANCDYGTRRIFVIPYLKRHEFLTKIEKLVEERSVAARNEQKQEEVVARQEEQSKPANPVPKKKPTPTVRIVSEEEFWERFYAAREIVSQGEIQHVMRRKYGAGSAQRIRDTKREEFLCDIEALAGDKRKQKQEAFNFDAVYEPKQEQTPVQEEEVAQKETALKKRRVRVPKYLRHSWRMQAYEALEDGTITNPIKARDLSEVVRARMNNEGFGARHTLNALKSKNAWGKETSFLHNMVYRIKRGKENRVYVVSFAPPEYIKAYGHYNDDTRKILEDISREEAVAERERWIV